MTEEESFYKIKVGLRYDVAFNGKILVTDLTNVQAEELISNLDDCFGEEILQDLEFDLEDASGQ